MQFLALASSVCRRRLVGEMVLRIPDIFNLHKKEGEPGNQSDVTNFTSYTCTKVGRVAGHDKVQGTRVRSLKASKSCV